MKNTENSGVYRLEVLKERWSCW